MSVRCSKVCPSVPLFLLFFHFFIFLFFIFYILWMTRNTLKQHAYTWAWMHAINWAQYNPKQHEHMLPKMAQTCPMWAQTCNMATDEHEWVQAGVNSHGTTACNLNGDQVIRYALPFHLSSPASFPLSPSLPPPSLLLFLALPSLPSPPPPLPGSCFFPSFSLVPM